MRKHGIIRVGDEQGRTRLKFWRRPGTNVPRRNVPKAQRRAAMVDDVFGDESALIMTTDRAVALATTLGHQPRARKRSR